VKSFASLIQKAFPVPHIFVLSDVAIKFFDGKLSFFEFGRSHGVTRPKDCGTIPFPHLKRDMMENRQIFAEAGNALKTFAQSKGYRMVRVIVHEGDVYAFKMRVPTTNVDEMRPAIEAALEENVPIPPAEAIFEFDIVSIDTVRNETSVAVTVISEKMVAVYMTLLQTAGLIPVAFETESRTMAKSLIPAGDQGTHAILAIEEHHSVIFIAEKGVMTFSSVVEFGSIDLTRAVAKTFNVTEDVARSFMTGKGLREGITETIVFESMVPAFSTFSDELEKVVLYFRGEAERNTVGENPGIVTDILLAGSDARISGLTQYLTATVKLPTRIGSVWTNVKFPAGVVPELEERQSLGYTSLIGAHFS
jgi:Tfp pilus assembly PilM family ATPase